MGEFENSSLLSFSIVYFFIILFLHLFRFAWRQQDINRVKTGLGLQRAIKVRFLLNHLT